MALLQSLLLHDNIFYKILNCLQKLKYYFGNYLQKPNIILANIYKKPNTLLVTLVWHLLYKKKKLKKIKKKKTPKLLGKKLFYQSLNVIWKKNYIMQKTQNYSLAKTYFDILNPQTHGKYKFLMTYYPHFKTISFTKFIATMLIFSIRNSNYKSPCILPMAKLFIL